MSYYTKSEIAEKLGVSKRTVDNWMAEGKISFTKVGRRIIFSENDLNQLIENNHREAFFYSQDDSSFHGLKNSYGKPDVKPTGQISTFDKQVKYLVK